MSASNFCFESTPHCWHDLGSRLMTNPPIMEVRCCNCGGFGRCYPEREKDPAHGKFAPSKLTYKLENSKFVTMGGMADVKPV